MSLAISVNNISKSFLLPHNKKNTLKEHFVGFFDKMEYEKFEALNDVSFEIKKGEFVGIIGRNGSGKSTLLKILSGIYNPDKGEIKSYGKISPFLELGVGFNPELTGRENIFLSAAVLGLTKKQIEKKYDKIVAFAELERFMDMKVKNYSSGMYVRLAFSIAIQVDADIIILDEVLAVGDSMFQKKCQKIFKKLITEDKTIVLVTHSMKDVEDYCDKAILLDKGRVISHGNVDKVIHNYRSMTEEGEESKLEEENKKRVEEAKEEKVEAHNEDKTVEENHNRWGTDEARIEDIVAYDKDGNEKYTFKSGDYVRFCIKYKKNKNMATINAGFTINTEQGLEILSANTLLDNHRSDTGKNIVEIIFDSIPLRFGTYYLNCSIFGQKLQPKYDYWKKIKFINIIKEKDNLYTGIVLSKYTWK